MITRDPSPKQPTIETLLSDTVSELQFRTKPSYREVRYPKIPSRCAPDESLYVKAILDDEGRLDAYMQLQSGLTALTYIKVPEEDMWRISGPGSGLIDNRDALGNIHNVLQVSVLDPEFKYMNVVDMDDATTFRAVTDSIRPYASPVEEICTYTHHSIGVSENGQLLDEEGITLGTVTEKGETFYFATLTMPFSLEDIHGSRQYTVEDYAESDDPVFRITCRVEVHPGSEPEYSAYYDDPNGGQLITVGIPGAKDMADKLFAGAIEAYLDELDRDALLA